jgi:lysophospholipase L1-like esterase
MTNFRTEKGGHIIADGEVLAEGGATNVRDWQKLLNKPTTIAASGLSDAATKAEVAAIGAGRIFKATKAALDADLSAADSTLAEVTQDPTAANNKVYVKVGASGIGSWQPWAFDRITPLQTDVAANKQLLGVMAAIAYPITSHADSIPLPVASQNNTSTFSGWGSPVGVRQHFNRVLFYVHPFDALDPVTQVRLQVRQTDIAGSILADKTVAVTAPQGVDTLVAIDLDATIENAGALPLFFMFWTDGKTGSRNLSSQQPYYPTPTYPIGRFSTSSSVTTTTSTPSTGNGTIPWFGIEYKDFAAPYAAPSAALEAQLATDLGTAQITPLVGSVHRIATDDYVETAVVDSLDKASSAFVNENSTFSGWGSNVGVRQNVDRVRFRLRAWDATHPITQVRARVQENDINGAVLGDKTIAVTAPTGATVEVEVTFDSRIVNAGALPLFVMFWTDGRTGEFGKVATTEYPSPPGPMPRYSTRSSVTDLTTSAATSNFAQWFELVTLDRNTLIAEPTDHFVEQLQARLSLASADPEADFLPSLPREVYATEGVECNVYLDSVAHNDTGGRFVPEITCARGRVLEECWRMTPVAADAAAGVAISLDLRVNGASAYNKAGTLKITAKTAATRAVSMLAIGDSLTAAGKYTQRLLTLTGLDLNTVLTLLGTQGSGTNKQEGHSGWKIADFNGETANVSPFIFSGAFNFPQYLSTNGIATPDFVTILLGINDIYNRSEVGNAMTTFAQQEFAKVETWITSIKAANAAVKIGICTTPMPAGVDGMSVVNNASRQLYLRRLFTWKRAQQDWFGGRQAANIYLIPTGCCLDTRRAFPVAAAAPAFAHDTGTVVRQNNNVHPADPGYFQIGDTIWATIKGIF